MSRKVCVIGLDCAPPELVFDLWADRLPNLRRVMECGVYGPLESAIPPITVPAWMCMMTGRDPGTLGIYGFRNRRDHSYDGLTFASSRLVREPAVWDVLADHEKRTIALGVPLTYPPRPINGLMVTDFLAPDTNSDYTYPSDLKHEIREVVGEYLFDTRNFRTDEKERLLADIYAMTAQRFQIARHLLTTKPWDLFVMVEMGPDRIHHGFWKYFDQRHHRYEAGHPLENAIRDYYVALDVQIGDFLALLDDETLVLIVSDHGAKRMDGGICFNQWLIEQGYLTLKAEPTGVTKFDPALVDWSKTKAWGDGGYYGRLFLNVQGREPQGIVPPAEVEALKAELTAKLEALGDEQGNPIGTKVYRPEQVYTEVRNVAPDLIVYFGNLHWRSVGSLGQPSVWTHDNDTGPDDANHAQHGIFLMVEAKEIKAAPSHPSPLSPKNRAEREQTETLPSPVLPPLPGASADASAGGAGGGGYRTGLSLYDVAPTVLNAFGIAPPPGMGRNTIGPRPPVAFDSAYSEEEEAELARRLEDLGYL